ncbi:DUF2207 domain-containing protein [Streptomyces sp. MBT62]|uniref:DUF2207 domain-containing protein n=1 Tax=Streptomyces sp. MBT62 TaxID=2800410 RepID=UPI00190B5E39|nr:DUF2207 domain-containing protein [Streptomyces sp. MBT62]MBK3565269.1 DUF2207 domain-containing protein [Streptomyces sp. MBT62]
MIVLVLVGFGGLGAGCQALSNTERVTSMWVGAEIRADGSVRITEVIDYDFGHSGQTHGIYRDVPDADFDADDVRATMDGHKVPYTSAFGAIYRDENGKESLADRLKVGDRNRTVGGVHRYRIQYSVPDAVKNGKLAWDAVGTGWKVERADVEIHVVDTHALTGLRCVHGNWDDGKPCSVRQSEPGHLVVKLDRLSGHEGLTLYATAAKARTVTAAALPTAPTDKAVGTSLPHPLRNGVLFLAVALVCVALTLGTLRFFGRDRVQEDGGRVRRVEVERLARSVTPSATPPEGLTPAQAGVLRLEKVTDQHKVAWLLSAAADGHLTVEGDDQYPVLKRHGRPVNREIRDVLDRMFTGGSSLALGFRNPSFKAGWDDLSWKLDVWRNASDLWDTTLTKRLVHWAWVQLAALFLALVLVVTGGVLNGHRIAAGLPVLLMGAVIAGLGLTVVARGWELDTRTPRGSALWLQVEAFRRYLADPATCPDAPPAEETAERYTAWAVSLGVEAAWEQAVGASTAAARASRSFSLGVSDVLLAAVVVSAANASSGSGSSGSGGGSSSGGVGGGAGGGGGGSW